MKLSEVINIAKHSELNTLGVRDNTQALISFVNMGLIELYSQFALYTEEYVIPLQTGITIYDLPNNFMYITGAYEAPAIGSPENSKPLPINEEGNPLSVNTINFKQVQVPLSINGTFIGIMYVPKPVTLTEDDLENEVPLPDQLLQPLLNYMAYKAHGAIRTDGQGEGDVYFIRYKRSCDDVKRQGVAIASDDLSMDNRLFYRGFP